MFLNSSSDMAGFYGTEGKGRNRDAFIDTDRGFFQQNIQFNQDLIFVNQLMGEHKFYTADEEDAKYTLTWGIGHNNVFAH